MDGRTFSQTQTLREQGKGNQHRASGTQHLLLPSKTSLKISPPFSSVQARSFVAACLSLLSPWGTAAEVAKARQSVQMATSFSMSLRRDHCLAGSCKILILKGGISICVYRPREHTHTHIHTQTYARTHAHTHAHYRCTRTHTHIHTHTHTHTHTRTHWYEIHARTRTYWYEIWTRLDKWHRY